ncbi:1-phosphofructokinase [Amycolatopsis sp. AA4]|uniref:1-phosphofructokinase n=1 Tax=Actinomycetes TaxID=1760 RepID=UPI0001B58110|nr:MULTISPECIES: 1-phosphofructokinase [Actinomycetes]ATY14325.1 1-phosphofructokinase [Amycolatopsis sp. AA4]EFL10400.1 1-phosphofructokinase [Streptomyces sp. AA4]
MIVTVTPNPSLDRTAQLSELRRGEVLRASRVRLDPGGKGVNVSRALAAAGSPTVALLPAGGSVGERLADLLAPEGVPVVAVPIAGTTRSNITLVEADGTTTKINEPGPEISPAELAVLQQRTVELAARAEWVVCCGSVPAGVPDDFYAQLGKLARDAGAKVAVDSSGAPLAAALAAGPDLIKPNLDELAELAGRPLPQLGDVVEVCRGLVADGVGAVLVSLGARGAVLVDRAETRHALGPLVAVRSTVGAGDAALAGFLHAGGTGPQALRAAVAYGTAAVAQEGSRMPAPQDVHPDQVRLLAADPTLTLSGAAA